MGAVIDSSRFRHVLGHFATGIAVITAQGEAGPVGMAVSSFTSVSLDPPLVAFLPDKSSTSWPPIQAAGRFCVNILSAGQRELCAQFARKGTDKFAGAKWQPAPSGSPVLDGVMAWIDCELTQTFESGDHYIAIGQVIHLEAVENLTPLVFFQGGYQHLNTSTRPDSAAEVTSSPPATSPTSAEPRSGDADTLRGDPSTTDAAVEQIVGGYVREFRDQCVAVAASSETPGDALRELLRIAFASMDTDRVAIMILQNERPYLKGRAELDYLRPLERDIDAIWRSALSSGIERGELRSDLELSVAYRFIRDVIFAAARWYRLDSAEPQADARSRADSYRESIISGLMI